MKTQITIRMKYEFGWYSQNISEKECQEIMAIASNNNDLSNRFANSAANNYFGLIPIKINQVFDNGPKLRYIDFFFEFNNAEDAILFKLKYGGVN